MTAPSTHAAPSVSPRSPAVVAPTPAKSGTPSALLVHRVALIADPGGAVRVVPLRDTSSLPEGAAIAFVVPATPADERALVMLLGALDRAH